MTDDSDREVFPADAPLLQGLTDEALGQLRRTSQPRCLAAGQVLFQEGDAGDSMYLIIQGSIRILRGGFIMAHRSAGDCIGEMAVLDGRLRSATAQAATACVLLRWSCVAILTVLESWPQLLKNMMRLMSDRLRGELHQRVEDLRQKQAFAVWLKTAKPSPEAPFLVISSEASLRDPLQQIFSGRNLTFLNELSEIDDYLAHRHRFAQATLPQAIFLDRNHESLADVEAKLKEAPVTAAIPGFLFEFVPKTAGSAAEMDPLKYAIIRQAPGDFRFFWILNPDAAATPPASPAPGS